MAIITATLVLAAGYTVLILFRTREDASILTSSLVFMYTLYLSWSAMASRPDESCNPMLNSDKNTVF